LLAISDLPEDEWFEDGAPSTDGAPIRIGIERIGTTIGATSLYDGVLHDIYRMQDEYSADWEYPGVVDDWFQPEKYLYEWSIPKDFSSLELHAEQYRIGCNVYRETGSEECDFVAQYGVYLVRFSICLQHLANEDVISMLKEIDNRMVSCLSGEDSK
jgi:hypothetical protein